MNISGICEIIGGILGALGTLGLMAGLKLHFDRKEAPHRRRMRIHSDLWKFFL